MKLLKTKLLGVEITVHNKREETLVSIARNEASSALRWMDVETADEVISSCDMVMRERIANKIATEVNGMFTSMYYLDMIKQSVCIYLDDIIMWNGED